jgi:hypothetical protein
MWRTFWLGGCALAAFVAADIATPTASHADGAKWCAVYGGRGGGARNCGFYTFEQCLQTIQGLGGFCERNQFYTGPADDPPPRRKRRDD